MPVYVPCIGMCLCKCVASKTQTMMSDLQVFVTHWTWVLQTTLGPLKEQYSLHFNPRDVLSSLFYLFFVYVCVSVYGHMMHMHTNAPESQRQRPQIALQLRHRPVWAAQTQLCQHSICSGLLSHFSSPQFFFLDCVLLSGHHFFL